MSRAAAPGAQYLGQRRCRFEVWAPRAARVEIEMISSRSGCIPLERGPAGCHSAEIDAVSPGDRYYVRLDGGPRRPDPASRFQPAGVHGPSEIVDPWFDWNDGHWKGIELEQCIIFELHVGTFTPAGTFAAMHEMLPRLRDLGVTAIELMPIAQFPGRRNWGYDGVSPYAVQNSYGGPAGLKQLVDACHQSGLAVILDVVYNHLGPEGNYLADFGPYFTNAVQTPWGAAINFAGRDSDEVRRYFIENALRWVDEFHIDGLRLDAPHAFHDPTARPFLAELTDAIHARAAELDRRILVIAESNLNDPRTVTPTDAFGSGCDAQWVDDFHHALHVALTGERHGYYADFDGVAALERSCRDAFVFTGQPSRYRGRRHGKSPVGIPGERFVICAQNHDQIGNRILGDRLTATLDFESLKLAAAAVVLAPFVPMLFMGEEYGEIAPFCYFVSHGNEELIEAVRRGRRHEFASFHWKGEPPDPQAPETFERSRLQHDLCEQEPHQTLRRFYQALLRQRRALPHRHWLDRTSMEVIREPDGPVIALHRRGAGQTTLTVLNFSNHDATIRLPSVEGREIKLLDSSATEWRGTGRPAPAELSINHGDHLPIAPRSVVLYGDVESANRR